MAKRSVSVRLSVEDQALFKRAMTDSGDHGERMMRRIQKASVPTSRGLRVVSAAGADVKGSMMGMANQMGPAGAALSALGPWGIAAGAGIGIAAMAMVDGTKKALDFRSGIAEISTLGFASEELAKLREQIKDVSGEFGKLPVDQTKAAYSIISAGASDAAEAITILTAANKLSIGGVTSVEVAADGLTSALNAWGVEAKNVTTVSDAFFTAVKDGKTTVGELAANIGAVAQPAAQTEVSIQQLLAATAALTKGGVSTSKAMNGLQAIIASVIKPSEEAKKLAKAIGLEFNVEALAAKDLSGFLQDMAVKTGGSSAKMAVLLGGTEALNPALALTGKSAQDFADSIEHMGVNSGAAQEAFDKMATDQAQKIAVIKANWEVFTIGVGEAILDHIVEPITDVGLALLGLDKIRRQLEDPDRPLIDISGGIATGGLDIDEFAEGRRRFVEENKNFVAEQEQAAKDAAKATEDALQATQDAYIQSAKGLAELDVVFPDLGFDFDEAIKGMEDLVAAEEDLEKQGESLERLSDRRAKSLGIDLELMTRRNRLMAETPLEVVDVLQQEERMRFLIASATQDQIDTLDELHAKERDSTVLQILQRGGKPTGLLEELQEQERQALKTGAVWDTTLSKLINNAKISGDKAGEGFLLGVRQSLLENEAADITIPMQQIGTTAGEEFESSFTDALSTAFEGLVRDGDFKDTAKGVGTSIANAALGGIADKLAESIVKSNLAQRFGNLAKDAAGSFTSGLSDGISEFFAGTPRELFFRLESGLERALDPAKNALENIIGPDLGGALGRGIAGALGTALVGVTLQSMGLDIPDEIIIGASVATGGLDILAKDSENWTKIRDGAQSAIAAGVVGAGIGQIIGDEVTAQSTGIGAALGSAIGLALDITGGGVIGGLIGLVAGLIGKEGREEEAARIKEIRLSISGAGGLPQLVNLAGGVASLAEERPDFFSAASVERGLLEDVLRGQFALDRQEGALAVQGILSGGTVSGRSAAEFERMQELFTLIGLDPSQLQRVSQAEDPGIPAHIRPPPTPIPTPVTPTTLPPLAGDVDMEDLFIGPRPEGFEEEPPEPARKPVTTTTTIRRVDEEPPEPSAKPIVPTVPTIQRVIDALNDTFQTGVGLSRSLLLGAGNSKVADAMVFSGRDPNSDVNALIRDIARGVGSSEFPLVVDHGIDIVAASGFHGTLPRDMVIQAHAGERVDISPSASSGGGGNTELNVSIGRIETPNVQSMRRWVDEELFPLILKNLRSLGRTRTPALSSKSIVQES